jgi:lysophospholipase L1-like esterase
MKALITRLLLALSIVSLAAFAQTPKQDPGTPAPKHADTTFIPKHERYLARGKSGPIGLLFMGDSITEGWHRAPHVWDAYYAKYNAASFGISGNRTQNVLWQIQHGELDGISPKVVVLMIGTNNSLDDSAADIAAANRKIVAAIRAKLPNTKVLLLAIFPRGPRPPQEVPVAKAEAEANKRMDVIDAVNRELMQMDDGRSVRYLNIGNTFLGQDGKIPYSIMPDQLHPTAAGYQLWADAMQKRLDEMMQP